jgi:hypothetical protein
MAPKVAPIICGTVMLIWVSLFESFAFAGTIELEVV